MTRQRIETFIGQVEALVESVTFDECGSMVAGKWVGGNGGLISPRTHRACDVVRAEIEKLRGELQSLADTFSEK